MVAELESALTKAAQVEQRRDGLRCAFEATTGRQLQGDLGGGPDEGSGAALVVTMC